MSKRLTVHSHILVYFVGEDKQINVHYMLLNITNTYCFSVYVFPGTHNAFQSLHRPFTQRLREYTVLSWELNLIPCAPDSRTSFEEWKKILCTKLFFLSRLDPQRMCVFHTCLAKHVGVPLKSLSNVLILVISCDRPHTTMQKLTHSSISKHLHINVPVLVYFKSQWRKHRGNR